MSREFEYWKRGNQWFPAIDIFLVGPKRQEMFKALIDSGASYSVFRDDVAEALGIEIFKGKEIYLGGVGGRILGYLHGLKVSLDRENFFRCKIVFSQEYTVSFNLLGRDNFFLPFLITFDEKHRKVKLTEN